MKKAIIIDTAINEDVFYEITGSRLSVDLSIIDDQISESANHCPGISHGTVCTALFSEFVSACEIGFISIVDEKGKLPIQNFSLALGRCLESKADLVCLSIGTENWLDMQVLEPIIKQLLKNGTIIVAASSNTGKITYPAALPEIIGVKYGKELSLGQVLRFKNAKDGINIIAGLPESSVLRTLISCYGFQEIETNSLAAPYVAAQLLNTSSGVIDQNDFIKGLNPFTFEPEDEKSCFDDVTIPIVGIMDTDITYAINLLTAFQMEQYVPALLTARRETDFYDNIFHLCSGSICDDILGYLKILSTDVVLIDMTSVYDDNIYALLDKVIYGSHTIAEAVHEIKESFVGQA